MKNWAFWYLLQFGTEFGEGKFEYNKKNKKFKFKMNNQVFDPKPFNTIPNNQDKINQELIHKIYGFDGANARVILKSLELELVPFVNNETVTID